MVPVEFSATTHRPVGGDGWLFVTIPQDVSDQMPARSMVAIEGVMNDYPFAGMLQPDNAGGHWLRVEAEWCEAVSVQAGEDVSFRIAPAKVEPEPEVPMDLHEALANAPAAAETWYSTTAVARRDWITWLGQGKKAETRMIRLAKMLDMLAKGKRRVCCFDRSGMASKAFTCPVAED